MREFSLSANCRINDTFTAEQPAAMPSAEENKDFVSTPHADDPSATERKKDHIELAFRSQEGNKGTDPRFYYEPLLAAHPEELKQKEFLGKQMCAPIWISSMTGGTALAGIINRNLAQACNEFGLGMGLGSCRSLLYSNDYFEDFNLRPIIGPAQPFYANLGIAQVEQLIANNELQKAVDLVGKLDADGLFIHVNPLQEWLQPEGDRLRKPPLETIQQFLSEVKMKVIVKEVGQGMGPESLKALFQLPLAAVDFAAHGGTNFSRLELMRSPKEKQDLYDHLAHQGHSTVEMVNITNATLASLGSKALCKEVIISGGIKNFLDGYYLLEKISCNAVYGQGSAMLERARNSYDELQEFIAGQIEGLKIAKAYLRVKS
jgi:isopentenyl-diphosphate delta-isomerase